MSHYTLEELLARWKHEDMTPEQMIGQLLLVLRRLDERVRTLERTAPPEPEPPRAAALKHRNQ